MQQPLHFTTANAPLAFALATVGFKLVAVWNKYTDAKLDSLKMPTAHAAKAVGKPGDITYAFERRDDLQSALDAWDSAGKALKAGEAIETNIEAADAIRVVRATLHGHDPFFELWKTVPAYYIQSKGEPISQEDGKGGREVSYPGMIVLSDGISEEDRKKVTR